MPTDGPKWWVMGPVRFVAIVVLMVGLAVPCALCLAWPGTGLERRADWLVDRVIRAIRATESRLAPGARVKAPRPAQERK